MAKAWPVLQGMSVLHFRVSIDKQHGKTNHHYEIWWQAQNYTKYYYCNSIVY